MPRENKEMCVRSDEQVIQQFKQFLSQNKLSTYEDGLKYLLGNVGSEVFLEYVDCEHFGEYPPDSKHFIQCKKSGTKVPRKKQDCQACGHHKTVRVLMQSKEKIRQETVKLERREADLITETNERRKELKNIENLASMPEQLKKKEKEIADLRSHYEDALKGEKDKNEYLDNEYRELEKKYLELDRQVGSLQRPPKSVLEVEKRLSEQQPSISEPQKVEGSRLAQTIQRVTEREKTEKERIVETVTSCPFTNQEIECPLKGQYVDIAKECKKGCTDYYECRFWQEINDGTAPLGAKIRLRES